MSIFNELLPKLCEISDAFTKNFNDDLKAAFDCFDKFEEEFQNGRGKARDKTQKDKNPMTTLQSIHEDEDEPTKISDTDSTKRSSNTDASGRSSTESNTTSKSRRASKKRSKNEVDGMSSPEQDKRQKRNASVKAQSIISKQVNVNLTQKLRREDNDKKSTASQRKDDDKENTEPLLNIQIKEEKISLPPEPEPMEMESLPLNIEVKQEPNKDDIAMPPPVAPVPKPRTKAVPKEKPAEETSEEESTGRRRTTRTKKQTDTAPAPVPASRSTRASSRASSRATKQTDAEEMAPPPADARPKRTRAKKKVSEPPNPEPEKETTQSSVESGLASPAEKPRPKRTRRAQKAAEKAEQKPEEEPIISPKEERISKPDVSSPILKPKEPKKHIDKSKIDLVSETIRSDDVDALDKTRVIGNASEMDKTMVLPNGMYSHAPVTPKNVRAMNETVVIEAATRETIVLDKPQNAIMDATVVIDKEPRAQNVTDDNSLLTDDSDTMEMHTPPKQEPPKLLPTSAVKEKVQQFEELATRVTRTKTRAMAKKEETPETHTPPDKIVKPVLSVETLNKMNNMIFNGKQISSSATKPRSNIPTAKPVVPASTSKLSGINRAREEAEAKREKEDARKKKEAMLEAKRELHKRKREEKMAAAAAAREAAERERRAAMELAARERMEKQAHADQGKLERQREAERKKAELARKVAETEERRRAEEHARQQRLAEEQRRADEARRKQLEEAAAMKKEAAIMAKEIEKRQKEYIEKQKLKQRIEDKSHTPLKTPGTSGWHGSALEPAYMADGFQYLNSDEDEEPVERPVPDWSTSKARKQQLFIQSQVGAGHVDRLFSVRVHSPDLRDIFPNIERARLKRTSSAVWRTPPSARLPAVTE
ncbi:inner centromere protein [Anticarsia gemmatalis]|uniref:inner centromere protein n=1 Tax=Anticarsia gemmatalis TaxID=129554 RepID=UPI003F76EF56